MRDAALTAAAIMPQQDATGGGAALPQSPPQLSQRLSQLRRPKLLIQAARLGQSDYRRERDLKRLGGQGLQPHAVIAHLLDVEGGIEAERQSGAVGYSIARHIEVLIAVLAEARIFTTRMQLVQ